MFVDSVAVVPFNMELPCVIILSMAELPSASYFAPGSVITSIDFIDEAGMAFRMSDAVAPLNVGSRCPLR